MRVIKLGGSLLEFDGLAAALATWLADQAPDANLMLVGGGRLADAIRDADRRHKLDPSAAHWLAIRAMALNARLVQALLPSALCVDHPDDVSAAAAGPRIVLFDPLALLQADEQLPQPLPHDWNVTSDSIAARIALRLGAAELVLLKSCLPTPPATLASAAAEGYVDPYFPKAACRVPLVRCVNLRDRVEWELRGGD
jgi:aspartokinase-like uncharacterized kinase